MLSLHLMHGRPLTRPGLRPLPFCVGSVAKGTVCWIPCLHWGMTSAADGGHLTYARGQDPDLELVQVVLPMVSCFPILVFNGA